MLDELGAIKTSSQGCIAHSRCQTANYGLASCIPNSLNLALVTTIIKPRYMLIVRASLTLHVCIQQVTDNYRSRFKLVVTESTSSILVEPANSNLALGTYYSQF